MDPCHSFKKEKDFIHIETIQDVACMWTFLTMLIAHWEASMNLRTIQISLFFFNIEARKYQGQDKSLQWISNEVDWT